MILCTLLLVSTITLIDCARKIPSRTIEGIASWYGKDFHGKKTASGERYNMYDLTAAHRSLPFGTKIRVTNLANNRKVIVTINDRGPFVKNRILDLSYGAARKLRFVKKGITRVKIEILK
jgi:peptidoglycan lytic transglycosylase